ncbi:MAG: hypothetical protein HYU37_05395 [Acidobacteria bacterium]|nr:hypothetical protein [Acidobacteriota bacterium]
MAAKTRPAFRGRRDFFMAAAGLSAATAVSGAAAAEIFAQASSSTPDEPGDRGLWITWYDLPENGREQYLTWLHRTYIPSLLKRPGYLWAAHYAAHERQDSGSSQIQHTRDPIGAGYRYILLIGAVDTHVFGNPTPRQIHAVLPEEGRRMLAMRQGERMNIAAEAGRCLGAGWKSYKEGLTTAPVVQIGSFNCPVEAEEEMHAGYVQSRLPAICQAPTSIRTRKLNSVVGWAKHIILYEFGSPELFERDYQAAIKRSPLGIGGNSVVPKLVHAPNGPNSAVRLWPPIARS